MAVNQLDEYPGTPSSLPPCSPSCGESMLDLRSGTFQLVSQSGRVNIFQYDEVTSVGWVIGSVRRMLLDERDICAPERDIQLFKGRGSGGTHRRLRKMHVKLYDVFDGLEDTEKLIHWQHVPAQARSRSRN